MWQPGAQPLPPSVGNSELTELPPEVLGRIFARLAAQLEEGFSLPALLDKPDLGTRWPWFEAGELGSVFWEACEEPGWARRAHVNDALLPLRAVCKALCKAVDVNVTILSVRVKAVMHTGTPNHHRLIHNLSQALPRWPNLRQLTLEWHEPAPNHAESVLAALSLSCPLLQTLHITATWTPRVKQGTTTSTRTSTSMLARMLMGARASSSASTSASTRASTSASTSPSTSNSPPLSGTQNFLDLLASFPSLRRLHISGASALFPPSGLFPPLPTLEFLSLKSIHTLAFTAPGPPHLTHLNMQHFGEEHSLLTDLQLRNLHLIPSLQILTLYHGTVPVLRLPETLHTLRLHELDVHHSLHTFSEPELSSLTRLELVTPSLTLQHFPQILRRASEDHLPVNNPPVPMADQRNGAAYRLARDSGGSNGARRDTPGQQSNQLTFLALSRTADFSHLQDLTALDVSNWVVYGGPRSDPSMALSSLTSLSRLRLGHFQCAQLPMLSCTDTLTQLELQAPSGASDLSRFSNLRALRVNLLDLTALSGLEQFENLQALELLNAADLTEPLDLECLTGSLQHLVLQSSCTWISELSRLPPPLPDFAAFESLSKLIRLSGIPTSISFQGLSFPPALRALELISCPSLLHLPMENLVNLESLQLSNLENLELTTSLRCLSNLRELHLTSLPVHDLEHVSSLSSLEGAIVKTCRSLTNIYLGSVRLLETVRVESCPALLRIQGRAAGWASLEVSDCDRLDLWTNPWYRQSERRPHRPLRPSLFGGPWNH